MGETADSKRIGIMGGTFDPIHNAHLILAEQAWNQFHLDKVLFLPAGNPPHKQTRCGGASKNERLEMVRLAIQDNPHFQLDTEEMERYGWSYTRDTLFRLKTQEPDAVFYFIIGADSLMSFDQWYRPADICSCCTLLAAVRNGMSMTEMTAQKEYLQERYHAKIEFIRMPDLDISSSKLRNMQQNGQSIRYYTPDAVCDYINRSGLYHTADPA
jgi:nicotinate-nucleotide adenylyltransferase